MSLTADRKTDRKMDDVQRLRAGVKAAAKLFTGAMGNRDAGGYAVPASDTAGHLFMGLSLSQQDNTLGGDGALTAEFSRWPFNAKASGMAIADLGEDAYVVDDETVGRGIAAQPVNLTGVAVKRIATSRGGTQALAGITGSGTYTLTYGGGAGVDVIAGGTFVLTAANGAQILVTVTAGALPGGNANDNIQMRHVRAGRIIEVVSATEVFVNPNL